MNCCKELWPQIVVLPAHGGRTPGSPSLQLRGLCLFPRTGVCVVRVTTGETRCGPRQTSPCGLGSQLCRGKRHVSQTLLPHSAPITGKPRGRRLPPCTSCSHGSRELTTGRLTTCWGKGKSAARPSGKLSSRAPHTRLRGLHQPPGDARPAGQRLRPGLFPSTWGSRVCRCLVGRGCLPRAKDVKQQAQRAKPRRPKTKGPKRVLKNRSL